MAIVIVDDTVFGLEMIKSYLKSEGYTDIITLRSAAELYKLVDDESCASSLDIDLIMMDIVMPDIDGIEACRSIKNREWLADVPIIMVTAITEKDDIKLAFSAGAMDYIKKPLEKVELLARVRSALNLKHETTRRKNREQELIEVTRQLKAANETLQKLSFIDGLTGIANRRYFNDILDKEYNKIEAEKIPLSLIMVDIDYFKDFNDTYGHIGGDDCLKAVAYALKNTLKRDNDTVARYGGEEFAIILPNTTEKDAYIVAEELRASIESAGITHQKSKCADCVTVSMGVVTKHPRHILSQNNMISAADKALYRSKRNGRNKVSVEKIM